MVAYADRALLVILFLMLALTCPRRECRQPGNVQPVCGCGWLIGHQYFDHLLFSFLLVLYSMTLLSSWEIDLAAMKPQQKHNAYASESIKCTHTHTHFKSDMCYNLDVNFIYKVVQGQLSAHARMLGHPQIHTDMCIHTHSHLP